MFYYFECSTPEVKNWLKVAAKFGWRFGDYTNNCEKFLVYIEPDTKWVQSAYHYMVGKDKGQKLSLKELTELIVNKKVPEPPKLYFKDLKVGDKFYFDLAILNKSPRLKVYDCNNEQRDVYLHIEDCELETLNTCNINTPVIKITD